MRPLSCPEVAEMVEEVALDNLPGDLRAAALDHLAGCAPCRTEVEQLAATADAILLACPSVEPPPGFDQRVTAAIRRSQRRHRPQLIALAAAAAAIVALSGGGVAVSRIGSHPGAATASFEGHELRTVKLIAADGHQIGDVSAYTGSPAWFFMRVTRGDASGTYRCVLDIDGGTSVALGDMFVSHGRGAWGQRIDLKGRRVRTARVVDATGATLATALLR